VGQQEGILPAHVRLADTDQQWMADTEILAQRENMKHLTPKFLEHKREIARASYLRCKAKPVLTLYQRTWPTGRSIAWMALSMPWKIERPNRLTGPW